MHKKGQKDPKRRETRERWSGRTIRGKVGFEAPTWLRPVDPNRLTARSSPLQYMAMQLDDEPILSGYLPLDPLARPALDPPSVAAPTSRSLSPRAGPMYTSEQKVPSTKYLLHALEGRDPLQLSPLPPVVFFPGAGLFVFPLKLLSRIRSLARFSNRQRLCIRYACSRCCMHRRRDPKDCRAAPPEGDPSQHPLIPGRGWTTTRLRAASSSFARRATLPDEHGLHAGQIVRRRPTQLF